LAAVYFGSFTVGGAIPGASVVLDEVGLALDALRLVVEAQSGPLLTAVASINAQADACLDAKAAIRIPACVDFEAQLNAALDLNASFQLQLTDPVLYLNGLIAGCVQVQANLSALVPPSIAITGQINATAALAVSLEAKIAAIDLQLSALLAISAGLAVIAEAILAIHAALAAAVAACLSALGNYLTLAGHLLAAGAHCFLYDGPLDGLGVAIDSVTPGAGIGGSVPVRVPIVLVRQDDTAAYDAVNATYRVA
jgi:hypothetical protein